MAYIINLCFESSGRSVFEYIGNGTYVVNHEKYAVITQEKDEAKKYSSYKRAENAYARLYETCFNVALSKEANIVQIES